MSDYFFKRFYDDVKGADWPTVDNYSQFKLAPKNIIDECYTEHAFKLRKNQLEDKEYWLQNGTHAIGYKYQNLLYVPVRKCATTNYTEFFHNTLGWKQVQLHNQDWDSIKAFGLIMHPLTRRLKGIVEAICISYNNDYSKILEQLEDPYFQTLINSISIMDTHSMPYTEIFGPILDKIHWIPMESNTKNLKMQITKFLKEQGLEITIPDIRLGASADQKLEIYNKIYELFVTHLSDAELYILFANDLKFYHNLLDKHYGQIDN